jgi:uncharacterized protein involved in exopolysaccharide biosynthesis
MRPVYRASTTLIPASDDSGVGGLGAVAGQYAGLASLVGIDIGSADSLKTEAVAVLGSRAFTESFIRDLDLTRTILPDEWDEAAGRWKETDPAKIPTVSDAARVFEQQVRGVSEDRQRGLITLSIEWYDREQAADWANTLVVRLNEYMRTRAISESQTSLEYLNKEVARTEVVELRQSIYRLIESQISRIMLANVRQQYSLRVVEPALVPTLRERVRPKRALIAIVGALVGLSLGTIAVLLAEATGLGTTRSRVAEGAP